MKWKIGHNKINDRTKGGSKIKKECNNTEPWVREEGMEGGSQEWREEGRKENKGQKKGGKNSMWLNQKDGVEEEGMQ